MSRAMISHGKNIFKFGWIPDHPDHRDQYFHGFSPLNSLPQKVDLRPNCAPIYNQGPLGSCTANAMAGALEIEMKELGKEVFVPSRLYIYYNTRYLQGSLNSDSGASLRNTLKACIWNGYCHEDMWPYDINNFRVHPSQNAYLDGNQRKLTQMCYQRVDQNIDQLRLALASNHPIVFGFSVYESFENSIVASTGVVSMPAQNESMLGGHAVTLVGYDTSTNYFIVRNSWGPEWGDQGYFYMPFSYVSSPSLANDFWIIDSAM